MTQGIRLKKLFGFAVPFGAVILGAGFLILMTFRFHSETRTHPFLTEDHLTALQTEFAKPRATSSEVRILFIGNSATLLNDLPARVGARAAQEGVETKVAMAAAFGARLIETKRLDQLRDLLQKVDWDIVVLQGFSTTALRFFDRWGAAYAISTLSQWAGGAEIVLFPPWARADHHRIYVTGDIFASVPETPQDLSRLNEGFYRGLADQNGYHLVAIHPKWLDVMAQKSDLFQDDGAYLTPKGSDEISRIIWDTLAPLVEK